MDKEKYKAYRRDLYRRNKLKDPFFMQKRRDREQAYNIMNPGKVAERCRRWALKHGKKKVRDENSKIRRESRKSQWVRTYESILARLRCSKNIEKYGNGYRCYIGIKNYLTKEDLKFLWERDGAGLHNPSIDRKDEKGDYTLENCQYIEMADNRKKVKRVYSGQFPFKCVNNT